MMFSRSILVTVFFAMATGHGEATHVRGNLDRFQNVLVHDTTPLDYACDQYTGQAHLLCKEFCEDKEESCIDYEQSNVQEKREICEGLKQHFVSLTGDESLPCEEHRCPCWTQQDVEQRFPDADSILMPQSCSNGRAPTAGGATMYLVESESHDDAAGNHLLVNMHRMHDFAFCTSRHGDATKHIYITKKEAQVCFQSIVDHCAKNGLAVSGVY